MTTSIIRAGGTGVPGVQTTGGDDGALALKVGPLAATVEALNISSTGTGAFVGQVTATGFTGTLDGILGSGTPAAATVTTFTSNGIDDNANAVAITIDSSENVGIGTASPGEALEIYRNQATTHARIKINNPHADSYGSGLNLVTNSRSWIVEANDNASGVDNAGAFAIYDATASAYRLVIKSTGNVGIGTTAPAELLHLSSSSDAGIRLDKSGVVAARIKSVTTGLAFFVDTSSGTTERMRIDSDGKVGFGATPGAPFDFRTGLAANSQFTINASTTAGSGAGGAFLKFHGSNAASAPQIAGIDGSMTNGTDGSESGMLAFFTTNSGTSAEKMRLLADGKFGVGTAVPRGVFQVKQSTNVNFMINTVTSGNITLNAINDANSANVPLELRSSQTNFTAGSVCINDTSNANNVRLNVKGNGGQHVIEVDLNSTNALYGILFTNPNGTVGNITVSGSTTAYNTSSDYRLKENVSYSFDATTRLKKLKPARFNFIADADSTVDGFLAHEVAEVVPEAVTGTKDEVKVWTSNEVDDGKAPDGVSAGDNKLDDDGNTIPIMQGIDQAKIVPLLVKTILELEARITALEG